MEGENSNQRLQQAQAQMSLSHFPQFMALTQPPGTAVAPQPQVTMAGGCGGVPGMYPLSALSLPPSMLTHNNLVTSIPKLILPGVKVNIINATILSYLLNYIQDNFSNLKLNKNERCYISQNFQQNTEIQFKTRSTSALSIQ